MSADFENAPSSQAFIDSIAKAAPDAEVVSEKDVQMLMA